MTSKDIVLFPTDGGEPLVTPSGLRRAMRSRSRVELDIYRRQLEIDKLVEFDRQDTEATGQALEYAFEREVALLRRVRSEARGDPAVLEFGSAEVGVLRLV